MLLREVEYARPSSVDEAVRLLAANDGARALAGGQTLVNVMKARAASPDVARRPEPARATCARSRSAATRSSWARWRPTRRSWPRPRSRSRGRSSPRWPRRSRTSRCGTAGTIGGNVCSNDPTNHLPPLLVALGASMTIRGADGERTVPAEEFFLGVYLTVVGEGELLTLRLRPRRREGRRRLRLDHDRPRRHLHRERGRDRLRRRDAAVALGCVDAVPILLDAERQRTRRASAKAVAERRARAAVRRACLRRLPAPSRRGLRGARRRSRRAERGR